MKKFPLYKKEKLCSVVAIEQLFGNNGADFSRLCYPLRVVARNNPRRSSDASIQFLISVPKKRLRHAVDRVLMRRRIREAFRLHKSQYPIPDGLRVDLAFVYVGNGLTNYQVISKSMIRLLTAMSEFYKDYNVESAQ